MKKSRFREVIKSGEIESQKDFADIIRLIEAYPYWANGYIILAKNAKKLQKDENAYLFNAAIRTPDRAHLKETILGRVSQPPPSPAKLPEEPIRIIADPPVIVNDDIFREIERNLSEIEIAKKNFFASSYGRDEDTVSKASDYSQDQLPETDADDNARNIPNIPELKLAKNDPETYNKEKESDNVLKTGEESKEEDNPVKSYLKQIEDHSSRSAENESLTSYPKKNVSDDSERGIQEEKSDDSLEREWTNPEDDQHTNDDPDKFEKLSREEQHQIIDEFIKKAPAMGADKTDLKKNDQDQEDLSKSSEHISDELFSENLALLMIRQGKKRKAIEIYRKLIWKFPQKKAYFANQIEKLSD